MHIGGREPFPVQFEDKSTFHQYLCMFDQQGVIKAIMTHLYAHDRHRLGEKGLRDEYVRLNAVKPGKLYGEREALRWLGPEH